MSRSVPSLADLHSLRCRLSSPELDQGHLFLGWPDRESDYTPKQVDLLVELLAFARGYPGGVEQYIRNGKRLLMAEGGGDKGEACAFQKLEMPGRIFTPPNLFQPSRELSALEAEGAQLAAKCVFVLVAGGLGERLGYSGIKVGLPVETATMRTYLWHYLSWARAAGGSEVPFVIMTSDDTHDRTVSLIEALQPAMPHLILLRQETVFCFTDSAAHLALSEDGQLIRKPHGHGDVHSLIYAAKLEKGNSGGRGGEQTLVNHWLVQGYQYIAFFQDTNATSTLTIPITLAISHREGLDMNVTCIPRQPKEAIGLLCRTLRSISSTSTSADGERAEMGWRTSIVEYNRFEDVAARLTEEGGDVAAAGSPYSPFPGSINTLVLDLVSYAARLTASRGAVPEFINPKYADASRRTFAKPARIESLMQDISLFLTEPEHRVGGTVFERHTYQPVKHSLSDACEKARQHMQPYCATTSEECFYALMRRRLRAVGVPLVDAEADMGVVVGGSIKTNLFPIITLDAVAATGGTGSGIGGLDDLARVFPQPEKVGIGAASTLTVEGKVVIESLALNGSLKVVGPPFGSTEAPLIVRHLTVDNCTWRVRPTTGEDTNEVDNIRGFILERTTPLIIDSPSKL